MKNLQRKQRIKLQDEINDMKENNISAIFEISSNQISIPLYSLVKYSQFVQEEIKKNEIFTELNKSVQKVAIKQKNSIETFLQLLKDEETEIKNEEFTDLLKLSEAFKVDILKNALKNYLHKHSKDVDFILNLMIEQENSKEITNFNEYLSKEMEECLKSNINECLQNDIIEQISVSSIYRMIEGSTRENISSDLLCRFILKSIKERHVLFHFVEVEKLTKEIFDELVKTYCKFNTQEHNQTHYFDYLPNNIIYINKLINKLKSYEERETKYKEEINLKSREIENNINIKEKQSQLIEQLKEINENMSKENKKKEEEISKIKKNIEFQENKYKEEIRIKENDKKELEKENLLLKTDNERIKQINQKKEDENQQLQETIKQLKKNIEEQKSNKPQFTGKIIEYLTKEFGGNVHEKGIVNVTSSSTCDINYHGKNAVDIHNKNNYFHSQNISDSWLKYDFIDRKVHPTGYSITTIYPYDSHHLRNWVIEGSNNGNDNDWVRLDTRQNETRLSGCNKTFTFDIKSQEGSYRYLRIRQTGKNSSGFINLVLGSLDFYGTLS